MIRRRIKGHPLMVFSYLYPYLFILVLPLLRAGVRYLRYGEISGLVLWEWLVFAVLLALAIAKWRRFTVTVDDNAIRIRSGILLCRTAEIPRDRLSSVCFADNPITRLLGCTTVLLHTESGRKGRADISFKVYKKEIAFLTEEKHPTESHRFSLSQILLTAAASSSAVSGLILAVPAVNKAARLLGNSIVDLLRRTVSDTEKLFGGIVPPVANLISLAFIVGYLTAFALFFLRTCGFRLDLTERTAEIRSGLFFRYRTRFRKEAVNDLVVERNLILWLFHRCRVRVSVGGYGEKRGELSIVAPAVPYRGVDRLTRLFYPPSDGAVVRPPKGSLYRFFNLPCLWLLALPALATLLCGLFPVFSAFINFTAAVASAFPLVFAWLGRYNYDNSRIVFSDTVFVRAANGMKCKELTCDREKIGLLTVRRFPADRRQDTCNLKLTIRSQSADRITVRHLQYSTLKETLKIWLMEEAI